MFIQRERYLRKIRPYYDVDLIKVLTGVRRCGKSILLEQIKEDFLKKGFDETHIIYINFEDLKYDDIKNDKKLNQFIMDKIEDNNKYLIFLDEIQHVKNFEKALASFRVSINSNIFVTGSNSKLLSGKLATLLVGRCIEFKIMPFTFLESYEYNKLIGKELNPDEFIFDYIKWGGFPLRFSFSSDNDIKRYLEQTYKGILDKDIINEKSKINRQNFEKVSSFILSNAGNDFSYKSIEKYFKLNNEEIIDKKTIYRYLNKMDKACILNRVKRFNIVGKNTMLFNEKQYIVDTGFRMINTNFITFENSFFLENIIYNELISRDYEVFVGKTYNSEVDFVVIKGNKKCYIQVAYYLINEETINREFKSLKQIRDASPKYVLSLDRFDFSRDGIRHINIVDFLLEKEDLYLS